MLKEKLKLALKEDIGSGDITTNSLIPKNWIITAKIYSHEAAVISGIGIVKQIFKIMDSRAKFTSYYKDGDKVAAGKAVIAIQAKARAILGAERVALNFLSHLSGIASETARFVDKIKPYKVKILDTRKTIPGLRELQKYTVICGGGLNHRFGLEGMVLIKDNHKIAMGKSYSIMRLIETCRRKNPGKKIEIEVENLKEFKQALKAFPDIIMLDNMPVSMIKQAVRIRNNYKGRKPKLEASGSVSLKNVRRLAKTGVDFISVGEITHSARSIDMSLEIVK